MTGYFRKEFNKVAEKAIVAYAKLYQESPENVSILMRLDETGEHAQFFTMVKNVAREQVGPVQLVQGPKAKLDFTGRFMLIPGFVVKAIQRLAAEGNWSARAVNLVVKWDEGEIYLFMMIDQQVVKLLGDEDVMTDEQIATDQMQLEEK